MYRCVAFAFKTLAILLFQQKRLGLSLQLLGEQLQSILEYDDRIWGYFADPGSPKPTSSPLLDALSLIDQTYAAPANMPVYLNVGVGEGGEA